MWIIIIFFSAYYNDRPKYVKKCHEIISTKYPDKLYNFLKKHNSSIENQENSNINTNSMDTNIINEALCKMSKSLFFDHKISYCSSYDVIKSSKK